jgi:hypothetical protein
VELLSRELGVLIFKLEQWRQKADAALDSALKEREADATSIELDAAMKRIGELSMEVERLARAHREARSFGPQEVALMAKAISPTPVSLTSSSASAGSGTCPARASTPLR